jgi:hypothetical protein
MQLENSHEAAEAVNSIPFAEEIAWCGVKGESLKDLSRD